MNTFSLSIPSGYTLSNLCTKLKSVYESKGFIVSVFPFENTVRMQFDKGCGGANYLFGLGQGITATLTVQKQTLMVTYSDAEWTGKIIGIAVGWFLCLIPFITGIIGAVRQSKLPDTITADIQYLISSGYEETQTNNISTKITVVEKIRKYKELLDQGIITEEEFAAKKAEILNQDL